MEPTRAGRTARTLRLAIAAVLLVLAGFLLPNVRLSWRVPATQAQGTGLDVHAALAPHTLGEGELYALAAKAAYRSVVNIDTTERVRVRSFLDDEFFGAPRFSEQQSHGSGVIIDVSGYVLTNEHVVGSQNDTSKHINVTLTDGRRFTGLVVGADHLTDVALVKITGANLPAAHIGTVKGLVPGQMVVALGNPLELRFTVTHGVVSALGRPVTTPDGRIYADLIQHDAFINPGNSGGALVNIQGEVIGINTLVYTQASGIGFAIPIDTALRVADELKRYGKIKRPWFGLAPVTNTSEMADSYGLPNVKGVVIARIWPQGPAAQAGLRVGDIVTKVNGQEIGTEEQFKNLEKGLRIGDTVKMQVVRGGSQGQTEVGVGEAP